MSEIEIKDKDALVKIFKTVSWLDERRWAYEDNYNLLNFSKDDLTDSEKILTHWICYITDRQMPFEKVWDKGGFIFSELVREYSRGNDRVVKEILDTYCPEKDQDEEGNEKFEFISKIDNSIHFASRYIPEDRQSILQTLEVLDEYPFDADGQEGKKRNIVAFILHFLKRSEGKEDLLIQVACALHLLTYQLDKKQANSDKIIEILKCDDKFEEKLKEFKKTSTTGKKRLWCSIRDYKKGSYHEIFKAAIEEVISDSTEAEKMINVWDKLPMDQIELPGDVWNNSPLFRDNLFENVLDLINVPKSWKMPDIIRDLYTQLKETGELENFYPEQFDITFDFVPKMCNKRLCEVCLFGKNGVDSICIRNSNKYCTMALLTCGYISWCNGGKGCMIGEDASKDICRGI